MPSARWLLVLALSGCATTAPDMTAPALMPYAADPRIEYEPGFEPYAERVARLLPGALARVETAHTLPFKRPVKLIVCGSDACFGHYVHAPKLSAAVITGDRLVLSPRLDGSEKNRLESLLPHELSHLHLGQRVGHYHTSVPVWFHEGWAALIAGGGGGAEYVSDAQVAAAIRAGRRIDLARRDTPDLRHRADAYGLTVYEFYRQAMLLLGWLRRHDAARFDQLVRAVQDNRDFEIAFWDVYGVSPAVQLAPFFAAALNGDNIGLTSAATSR